MANLILLKKSSVAAKVPTTGDLDYGELALNYADGALYYKTSGNAIARLNPPESIGFANVAVSGQSTLVADTATGTLTVAAGNGAITVTTNSGTDTLTISHTDTSSVANLSSDNSAGVVLQDIAFTFDTYGHVQTATVATTNLDTRYLQTESDTLATVTTRGATTTNAITVGGLTVNGASSLAGDVTNVDSISFDLTAAEATGIGKLYWDAGAGELRYGLGGGNVEVAIGQTQVTYVRNAETSTITKGQVVYLFGAQGDRPSVKLASNSADTTSNKTFGIAAENIAANSDGYVINTGVLSGVDTSAYTPGDILWLGSTAGTYTTTKAVAPNHLVFIGVVVKANQGGGQIFVKPQNGYELDEIHDVLISGIGLNHSLFYDTSVNVWKNYAPSAARTNLGLGTIATQNANNVSISGGAIDGTPIGATTPSTGKFTTLQTTGDATIGGNLTVSGTTTTVNAQNLNISDNLFYLNAGSTNTNPDLGFAANYNDGTYRHAGFFRDATDGYWKVFKNYTPEPDASIYIDTSHASFALADIQAANFRGALVGNATTASTLAGTPTINGVTFNGGSNITITASTTNALTIGDGLSGTSFNGSSAVTIAADSTIARRADVHYIGTTSIALNRTSAAQTLTGINGLTAVGTDQSITLTPTGTGGVGIGTSSPNELLSIGYIDGSYGRIEFRSASYARQAIIEGVDDASGGNGHLAIYTRNSGSVFERLRVTSTGRLGIGTTNPTAKIHAMSGAAYLRATLESETTPQIIISNGTQIINFGINGDVIPSVTAQSNDPLVFGTNNIERARFTAAGNFGIGTTSPSAKLSVVGTSDQTQFLIKNYSSQGNYTFQLQNSSGNAVLAFAASGSIVRPATVAGDLTLEQLGANSITFNTNGSEKVRITSSGDIGVGTTSPTAKVDVYGGASATPQTYILARAGSFTTVLGAQDSAGVAQESFVGSLTNNDFKFKTNNIEYMRLKSDGNFGIGTASPSQKVHILGSADMAGLLVATSTGRARITIDSSATSSYSYLEFNSGGSQIAFLDGSWDANRLRIATNKSAAYIAFETGAQSEKMRITSDGNVGVGITNPSNKFVVFDSKNTSTWNTSAAGNIVTAQIHNADGTIGRAGVLELIQDYHSSVRLAGYKVDNTNYWLSNFGISVRKLDTNMHQVFTIQYDGNVGIGTTSPSEKLAVSGGNISLTYNSNNPNVRVIDGAIITKLQSQSVGDTAGAIGTESNHTLKLITGNSARVTIDTSGNVGIGTTTPASKLDVNGISTLRDTINIGPSIGVISWGSMGGGTGFGIRSESGRALSLGANAAWDYLVINTSGNVGIGTAFPSYKLHVMGDARMGANGQRLYFYDDGNAHIHSTSTPLWINAEDNTSNIYINHQYNGGVILTKAGGGNVGIGEASPTQKLHVAGNARITGAIYDSANSAGTNGQVLTSTGTGTAWSSSGVAVSGTGTAGKIAKWSATTALGDSVITESSGNIGIDTTPTQKLDVNGNIGWGADHVLGYSTITTTATTANQVITSVSATTYRTFKFVIQAVDATAGKYQSQEIMAIHNGSTVAHTEYTAINVGGAVATYDVDISGSTVRLLCTPLSANSTVFKVSMQLIKV